MDATQLSRRPFRAEARRLATAGASALVVAVLLSGCGSAEDDETGTPASPSASTPGAEQTETSATESETPTGDAQTTTSEAAAPSSPDDEEAAEAAVITISEFTFEVSGTVGPGTEVTVVNEDSVGHTVTSDEEGLFDVAVDGGEEATFTVPEEPGEYSFYCRPHPYMTSVLVVG